MQAVPVVLPVPLLPSKWNSRSLDSSRCEPMQIKSNKKYCDNGWSVQCAMYTHSSCITYCYIFSTKFVHYIVWACLQSDVRILFCTFRHMYLKSSFQNNVASVVWTHDGVFVAGLLVHDVCNVVYLQKLENSLKSLILFIFVRKIRLLRSGACFVCIKWQMEGHNSLLLHLEQLLLDSYFQCE